MRTYTVKAGDSPGAIAAEHAGCPKCSRDLTLVNEHKPTVTYPNGYVTFKSLQIGEQLRLPDKWFDPRFELLPPAYFASLPYADGVTPSPFGAAAPGILRDFRALDVAADKLTALANAGSHMDDEAFASDARNVAAAINAAYQPALGNASASQYVHAAQEALRWATQAETRAEIQKALAGALGDAQLAMKELYSTTQPPVHS